MVKNGYLTLIAFFISFITFSQITRPCTIYLKSGEVISGMRGTYGTEDFKYYKKVGDRFNKIDVQLLNSVTLVEESGTITTLRFLPVIGEKKIQVVEQLLTGKLELYQQIINGYNISYSEYYIRKKGQDKLTLLGHHNFRNKKKKPILYSFINDCPEIIDKIESGSLRQINDLNIIIATYNITCGLP